MALFTGPGNLSISGSHSRVHDIEMGETGILISDGSFARIRHVVGALTVTGGFTVVTDCTLNEVIVQADHCKFDADDFQSSTHGADVLGNYNIFTGSTFENGTAAANTYDSLRFAGDRNRVQDCTFIPAAASTRSGVNVVSGDRNMVWGNDLGDPADYTNDAIVDAGTNTQLVFPNDATYGDNLTT